MKKRKFLFTLATTAAVLVMMLSVSSPASGQAGTLDPASIPKYVTPLFVPPVMPMSETVSGADSYEVAARQIQRQVLPAPLPKTKVWAAPTTTPPTTMPPHMTTTPPTTTKPPGHGDDDDDVDLDGFKDDDDDRVKTDDKGETEEDEELEADDEECRVRIEKGTKLEDASGKDIDRLSHSHENSPPAAAEGKSIVSAVHILGPDGAKFSPGVTVTIKYDTARIPGGLEEKDGDLHVAYWDGKDWVKLASDVDVMNKTVSAKTDHFSTFAVIAAPASGLNWTIIGTALGAGVIIILLFVVLRPKRANL